MMVQPLYQGQIKAHSFFFGGGTGTSPNVKFSWSSSAQGQEKNSIQL